MNVSIRLLLVALLVAVIAAGCSEHRAGPTQPLDESASVRAALEAGRHSMKASRKGNKSYMVTIENLTSGQPLSPPVAATHKNSEHLFGVRDLASPGIEAIAEDGNEAPMFERLSQSKKVTQAVDVGRPLTPHGSSAGGFSSVASFMIEGKGGDRFSLATMLICSNDGFTGLDGVKLPKKDAVVYYLYAYDAGTEDNTESSMDIPDPCSGIGPVALSGDPNGNEDRPVDTHPHRRIRHHRGIMGNGDLSAQQHGWQGPIAKVTIELAH